MPLVSIPLAQLRRLVGDDLGRDELVRALEELGSDVEGRAVMTYYRCDRCGQVTEVLEHEDFNNVCAACGSDDIKATKTSEVIRINLLPVRPDMFDAAGLSRALRGYLCIETGLPEYVLADSGFRVTVKPGLEAVRPHIVSCVVRGLVMDDDTVKTVMKMQENLHWALGRDRRRASIGVYDLDTVKPDFEYRPVKPDGVRFVPLFGMPKEGTGEAEMREATPEEILAKHPKGTGYRHLLAPFAEYPLLADSEGRVLSMPPIINSEESRVTSDTRNLFVDVTGPDKNAIKRTLAVIACSLADLGAKIETVEVAYPDGRTEKTPDLTPGRIDLNTGEMVRVLGFDVPDVRSCLERMRYGTGSGPAAQRSSDPVHGVPSLDRVTTRPLDHLSVTIPAYRSDIMHEYDVIEDVGIAFGYHKINPVLVPTMTVSKAHPIEELSEICRRTMTGLGFFETMTLILTNEKEHFEMLRLAVPEAYCRIDNPASVEQTMTREHLLGGLLSTFRVNVSHEMPQSIFEVGDCFEPATGNETGVRSRRKLAAGVAGPKAGFADARQLLDALTRELNLVVRVGSSTHPSFIPGRAAEIQLRRAGREFKLGVLGEIHPAVLESYGIGQPVALIEVGLDLLV